MDKSIYRCERCGRTFPDIPEGGILANAEALEIWGVENALDDLRMAVICDECWEVIKPRYPHFGRLSGDALVEFRRKEMQE